MKKFIVIYHAPAASAQEMANVSTEDQKKGMEAWMTWAKKCGNKLVDMGAPLMGGQSLHVDGTNGNSTKNVSGYSILQAENMDAAKSLLQGHPHLAHKAVNSIEIHETMSLPGM